MKPSCFLLIFALLLPSTTLPSLKTIRGLKPQELEKPMLKHTSLAASEHDYPLMHNHLMNKVYRAMLDEFAQFHEECKKTLGQETSEHLLKNRDGSPMDRLAEIKKIQPSNLNRNPVIASRQLEKHIQLAYAQQLYFAYQDLYTTYQPQWHLPYIEQRHELLQSMSRRTQEITAPSRATVQAEQLPDDRTSPSA